MRSSSILLALTISASVAAQQPDTTANLNLQLITSGAYSRSHDYDLIHQRIALRDFDWDSTSFVGSVATSLVARRAGLDSVILDAGQLLDIRRVSGPAGAALRETRHGDSLIVHLPAPVSFGDTVRFTIDYGGKVENGRGLTFIEERPNTPRQIWSQGEAQDNHLWFPTYDFPNDKMTWELEATVPAADVAVSNGRLVGDARAASGTHTMRWSQDSPSATYLVSLVVAPLARVHDTWRGKPVDYYVYHQDSALARPLFRVTPDMIEVYSSLTGVPYPWAKYAQTTVADFFGGMENVSATTLVDWLPDARAYADRPWYQYILIPHELAHQWFGDYVTTGNWANTWLNEGFAEFMPGQYWARRRGPHAEQDYYDDEYRQFTAIDARQRMPLASLGSNNIYPKGALVLEMLKRYLGEQRFWAGLHRYLTAHAYGDALTDDLRQAFLEATGENLDWFFDEWMYAAGYPEFTVDASYDGAAHRVLLHVRQTQRDTAVADTAGMRYVVPKAFHMPVTVRVGTTEGDVVRRVWIAAREDTIVVDSVRSAPTMVVFDDGNAILKKLTFEEPTGWLSTQLRRDPDLWNQEWVIQQLAQRPTDAAAGAAIAAAATSADYDLTRAQASSALAKFPADVAVPVLARVVSDTASRVRSAAVTALGQLGGPRALDVARAAWRNDRSYDVRAAAFSALVRLDSGNRRALIAEGLRTPSYQDVIQNAAIGAAVRLMDTSSVARLQELVGTRELPAHALAVLASRGDSRSLDLLSADLNDERPWVRRWALAAFTSSMDPARALPALKEAQGKAHSSRHAGRGGQSDRAHGESERGSGTRRAMTGKPRGAEPKEERNRKRGAADSDRAGGCAGPRCGRLDESAVAYVSSRATRGIRTRTQCRSALLFRLRLSCGPAPFSPPLSFRFRFSFASPFLGLLAPFSVSLLFRFRSSQSSRSLFGPAPLSLPLLSPYP